MELQELYGLMERFAASGLTELEWQQGDERICLRRAPAQAVQAAPAPVVPAAQDTINRQELIAAVSAALAEELGTDVSAIRVLSFRKLS